MAKRSLLLVDGDAKSLRVLEVSLKKAGFNVTTATTGDDALQKVQNSQPDSVISDTEMEDMDGYAFCREFKKNPDWAEIPFVFLTGQTAIENKIKGLELGVDDYLTKPIYIKEILTRVRILLQKRDRANFEQKKDNNTRFAGRLNDMGVVDLIQTIEVSRKTGVIHFRADERRQATLFFKEGKVIDAEAGHLQGEDAVYRLLTWSDGEFEALFRPVRRKPVIEMSAQGLLMEGMRRLDEWGRLQEQLPPLSQRFEVVYDELWDRLADLPDDLNQILRLFDTRRTLAEVIDGANIGDLETVEIISKLYFEGIIVEAGSQGGTSGSFPIEELLNANKKKREIPADLEDTIPEQGIPESAPPDSDDLAAAAAAAVAASDAAAAKHAGLLGVDTAAITATAEEDPEETTEFTGPRSSAPDPSALAGLLEQAITEAEPIARSEDPRRTTAKGFAVAQVNLKKRKTTKEELLAENLRKNGSDAARPVTKPYGTPPPPAEDPHEQETLDIAAEMAQVVSSGEAKPPDEDPQQETAEAKGELLDSDAIDGEREGQGEDAEDDAQEEEGSTPSTEAKAAEQDAVPHAITDEEGDFDDQDTADFEVNAEYPNEEEGDEAPARPYVEEVSVSGMISSEGAVNASVSGSLATPVPENSVISEDAEDPPVEEPPERRKVISAYDEDQEDEAPSRPFPIWLAVGAIAAGVMGFLIINGGDSGKSPELDANQSTTSVGDPPKDPVGDPPKDPVGDPPKDPVGDPPKDPVGDPPKDPVGDPPKDPVGDPPKDPVGDPPKDPVGDPPKDPVGDPPKDPVGDPPKDPVAAPENDTQAQIKLLLTSARRAKRKGDRLEALQLVDEALELRKSSTALLMKAEILIAVGDSSAALEVASQLTKVAPKRAQGWRIKGLAQYELKDYASARRSFGRYLELAPNARDAQDVRTLLESM